MKISVRTVTAICGAFALVLLYLVFLLRFLALADWSALSEIELWVFVTMLLRIIALAALGRRFQLPPLVPIIVFSIESLLIPPLIALFVFTGNAAYSAAMSTILTAWIGVTAVLLSPYLIYDFGKYMRIDPSLWGIFFIGALEYAFNLFMATLLSGTNDSISGFVGLGNYFILSLKSYATSATATGSLVITASSLIFFISLLLFASVGHATVETNLKLRDVLLVPLIAVVVLLVWTVTAVGFTSNMLFVLSAPVFGLAVVIWGGTRGKA